MGNIAVIGSGPAGLAAAIFLHRRGNRVTIYEQFDKAAPIGSGLMLQPTGMSVLHDLDLLEPILAHGQKITRIFGSDAVSGKAVLDASYDRLGGSHFGLGIHRHALFSTLFEHAVSLGVDFEFGKKIERLISTASGVRPVTDSGRQLAEHDLSIVAAGSHTTIAGHLFELKAVDPLPFGALWATLDWPENGFREDTLEQRYRGTGVMVGVLPLGRTLARQQDPQTRANNKAALFWSLKPHDLDLVRQQGIECLKEQICQQWPQTDRLLDQIDSLDEMVFAQYRHYTLKKPNIGRTIFIGDAFHSTSPQLGQGANMALLDAMALDMAFARSGSEFDKIGNEFSALRMRQIRIYQFLSKLLTPFYQSDSRALGFFRDHILSSLSQIPPGPWLMAALVSGLAVKPFGRSGPDNTLVQPDWHLLRS